MRVEQHLAIDADHALAVLYAQHYQSLLRLAALLLDEPAACEDIVQESYIRVATAKTALREPEKALAYLRQTVVNLSRSSLRRRLVVLRHAPKPLPEGAPADEGAFAALERQAVVRALAKLPPRQREAVVLRYYGDLSETQIAAAMGVTNGAVKSYCSRGLETLGTLLGDLA